MKIIGITGTGSDDKASLNYAYVNAFTRRDTTAVIIPVIKRSTNEFDTAYEEKDLKERAISVLNGLDALVLSGGVDVNPLLFNYKANASSNYIDTWRDKWELALLLAAIEIKKPVMGICRGFQLIGLHFDVPGFVQHLGNNVEELHNLGENGIKTRNEQAHSIYLKDNELRDYLVEKGKISKSERYVSVNSWHHQGFQLRSDGKDANTTDESKYFEDMKKSGMIPVALTYHLLEAFKAKDLPIFAVQWHPEEYGNNGTIIRYFLDTYVRENKKQETRRAGDVSVDEAKV